MLSSNFIYVILFIILIVTFSKLSQGISVCPQTTYSKMASWRKAYCCCVYTRG